MNFKLIFGVISFVLTIIGFVPYIRNIIKRKTIAHIYTWIIWGILQLIVVVVQLKNGAGYGSLSGVVGVFACFFIVFISLRNGFKNIKIFDTICLILAVIAIFIYIRLDNPLLAVIVATATNFIGFLPTLRKTYIDPTSETMISYLLGAIGAFLSILALGNYTLANSIYLINILVTNSILIGMVMILKKTRTSC